MGVLIAQLIEALDRLVAMVRIELSTLARIEARVEALEKASARKD
jgi:hypothetical protein